MMLINFNIFLLSFQKTHDANEPESPMGTKGSSGSNI